MKKFPRGIEIAKSPEVMEAVRAAEYYLSSLLILCHALQLELFRAFELL